MKNKQLQTMLYLAIWVLEGVALAFAVSSVWRLNMLPDHYLMIMVALVLLIWALSGLALLLPSRKAGGGKIRRCIAGVMAFLVVLGCSLLSTVVTDIYETMHQALDNPTDNTIKRSVYVLADNSAQTLEDTKTFTFAKVTGYDDAYTGGAIAVIERTLGSNITVQEFASVSDMVAAMYDGTVDAIILNSSYITILEESTVYTDFTQRTKVLCQVEVKEEDIPATTEPTKPTEPVGPTGPTEPTEEVTEPTEDPELTRPSIPEVTMPPIEEPKDITETPFVIYVSGNDVRGSVVQDGRSDVNVLVVVNPETKQILLLNTPRDYYIPNPAGGGKLDKLTHCGNDGVNNSMQALSELYNLPIKYYANINFSGFETFIDAIGGIVVYSDYSFTAGDTWIYWGENYLNGEQALSFARERYNVPGGDLTRGKNQMKVIKAVIQKITSGTTLISRYSEILDSLGSMFRMNLTMDEISQLVKMQLNDMATWEISSYTVKGRGDGTGVYAYTYSVPGVPLWVLPPDYDTVEYASKLVEKVVSGGILTEEDLAGPVK